ncbi:uncharacterized protein TNIN_500051 [Trichonephila inaurata madagascariensis]|uniref:Uncharacterized protein n=1 Tax=Trichonephila inaurata madagascariensis TaxID=2747483 RepID=A0A8X6XU26_9ARAC|nr:uncharacterized protein TNIN_500051 [Trichonephila inaurata madagascariensis]
MNSFVVVALVCALTALTLVEGRKHRKREENPGVKALIPACLPLSNAIDERIQEMHEEFRGPRDCEDLEECIRSEVNKFRCGLKEKPSQECIDQIVSFLQNDTCIE